MKYFRFGLLTTSIMSLIFFTGCANTSISIPITGLSHIKTVQKNNTVTMTLYDQKITLPSNNPNLLQPNDYTVMSLNKYVIGTADQQLYYNFNLDTLPYYQIDFNQPTFVSSLKIYNDIGLSATGNIVGDTINNIVFLQPLGKMITGNLRPIKQLSYSFDTENTWQKYTISDDNLKNPSFVLPLNFKFPIKRLKIAITKLYAGLQAIPNKGAYISKANTIQVIGSTNNDYTGIIDYVLKHRNNSSLNEELIHDALIHNPSSFKILKKNAKHYILQQYSILNLPYNADVRYAARNMGKIISTNMYKNNIGRFEYLNKKSNFSKLTSIGTAQDYVAPTKIDVHKAEIKHYKVNNQYIQKAGYIDFSKGLN